MFKGSQDNTSMVLIRLQRDGHRYVADFGYSTRNLTPEALADYAREHIFPAPDGNQVGAFIEGAQSYRNPPYKAIQKLAASYRKKSDFRTAEAAWRYAARCELRLIRLLTRLDAAEAEKVHDTFCEGYFSCTIW